MRRIVLLGLGALLAGGCVGRRAAEPESGLTPSTPPSVSGPLVETNRSNLIVTPATQLEGKIALVNPNARYVVIAFPVGPMPALEQQMPVYRTGLKVGEVRITGPQRDFNIAADILVGECQVGDEVREK